MADHTAPPPRVRFDEFTVPSYEEWRAAAEDSLKGADFDKKLTTRTYEGINLQPLYMQADAAGIAHQHSLPGQAPYVRGIDARPGPWLVAQELIYGTPEAFNDALRFDMERGQTAVNLIIDEATRAGLDPDQAPPEKVGRDGVSIASLDDMARALDGIDLSQTPILIRAAVAGVPMLAMLAALMRRQGKDTRTLQGCIEVDPLGAMAWTGRLPLSLGRAYDEMALLVNWSQTHAPDLDVIGVHSYPYHNAGASAVQELAYAIASGVAYLRAMSERGLDVNTVAPRMRFFFSVGTNFFMEVAKLRAARLLWSQVVEAFGGDADAGRMVIHARSALYNKTALDPYANMLRTTIEAFAGAVGGVQSMAVGPFDEVIRPPDEFSRRIARNQQIILQSESNLARLIDPAGGSWYVEYLTDQVAQSAWAQFQQIEGAGGMAQALRDGSPQADIAEVAQQRTANVSKRKDRVVGSNMYANIHEKPLAVAADDGSIARKRAAQMAHHRTHDDAAAHTAALDKLSGMLEATPETLLEAVVQAAAAGATLNEITRTLRAGDAPDAPISGLPRERRAEPFEQLRAAASAYAEANGHLPRIFMANMGPLSQHKARADFSVGFFEAGGFEMISQGGFESVEAAAQAAIASGERAVIICSTDDNYPDIVPPLIAQVRAERPETVFILAGYPKDQIEQLRAAGVDLFIYLGADCHAINQQLQALSGVQS